MKDYIGIKQVKAMPCTAAGAAEILNREICADNANENGDGYLVRHEDGYTSWSPAAPFNDAYRQAEGMTFGMAMEVMKAGGKVTRQGWNGGGMYLEAQFPDENSMNTFPYLVITVPGCEEGVRRLPWQPAQVDIFRDDWRVVGGTA